MCRPHDAAPANLSLTQPFRLQETKRQANRENTVLTRILAEAVSLPTGNIQLVPAQTKTTPENRRQPLKSRSVRIKGKLACAAQIEAEIWVVPTRFLQVFGEMSLASNDFTVRLPANLPYKQEDAFGQRHAESVAGDHR